MKNKYKIVGSEVIIFLNRKDGNDVHAIILLSDLNKVKKHKGTWCAQYSLSTKSFYVISSMFKRDIRGRRRVRLLLHRYIMRPPEDMVVDHINHDTLNNTRGNLRVVTQRENLMNRRVKHKIIS